MSLTKEQFLREYREGLKRYRWTGNEEKLNNFMKSVQVTIFSQGSTWNQDSEVAKEIWKAHGLTKYSLKALRALPVGE